MSHPLAAAEPTTPRKVLLPRRNVTPLLHEVQSQLIEQLWLLLPQGLVGSSREARHLIRTLRQRVEKAGETRLGKGDSPGHEPLEVPGDDLITTSRENDAKTASPLGCGVPRSAVPSAADCVRTAVCRPRDASPPGMSEMLLKARSGTLVQKLWACGPLFFWSAGRKQARGGPPRA